MYYCPKCDRTISKERIEQASKELKERFGVDKLSERKCPVCGSEYIDLERVPEGGKNYVGKGKQAGSP